VRNGTVAPPPPVPESTGVPSVRARPSRTAALPSNRPHSTGHTSTMGRSQMTMPPEWMPRCRGARSTSRASASTGSGMSCPVGPRPSSAAVDATVDHMSICFDQASCWPGE
jgi:hypothetical protein